MEDRVYLNRYDDNTVWVLTDDDPLGLVVDCSAIEDGNMQLMFALAIYLGFEPAELLNMED